MKKIANCIAYFIITTIIASCSNSDQKTDPISGKNEELILNPRDKAKKYVEKGGGIFGDFTKNRNNTTYNFATSNVMWRATLKTINFLPLQAIDYAGGVIVTDWYSNSSNSHESIKINIQFLSDVVSANSIMINSYKKKCDESYSKCNITKSTDAFNEEIKSKIMREVVSLSIEDEKNKKNK